MQRWKKVAVRRDLWFTALCVVGLSLTAATYGARQGPKPPLPDLQEVADNLYFIAASDPSDQSTWTGGNTVVFVTDSGVVLVDTKLAGYGQDILARVRTVTDKPVTTIINTHTHYDHTGSNTEFPDTVNVVVHENTRANMARATCDPITNCDAFKGDNARYLPQQTFSNRTSLFTGKDQIDLYYFGRGHTSGDAFVVFRDARTLHTGDMFQRKTLPFIDAADAGGSAVEFAQTLSNAIAGIENIETVIPGHVDRPLAWNDFTEFADFYSDVLRVAQEGLSAGRSVDDVASAYTLPDRFREYQVSADSVRGLVELIRSEQ